MQRILFDQGGYIIPVFPNAVAAMRTAVGGFPASDVRGTGPITAPDVSRLYLA